MHGSLHLILATESDRSRRADASQAPSPPRCAARSPPPRRGWLQRTAFPRALPRERTPPPSVTTLPHPSAAGDRPPLPAMFPTGRAILPAAPAQRGRRSGGGPPQPQPKARRRAASVIASAGKNDSIASSATVMSSAVPNVASVPNSVNPTLTCNARTTIPPRKIAS